MRVLSLAPTCIAALVCLPVNVIASQSVASATEKRIAIVGATGFTRDGAVGYHGLIGLEALTPVRRLRFRGEALFADLGGTRTTSAFAVTSVASALAAPSSPYLLASVATTNSAGWQRGWSLGLGWRFSLGNRLAFVESRAYAFHKPRRADPLASDWRYLTTPVSFGLRF
jgi:hypothetical protein